jgi:hypothetical protein
MPPCPWSRMHSCCVECGTTKRPHAALGRCNPCYRRQYYRTHGARHTAGVRAWRERNPERKRRNDHAFHTRNKERLNAQARERYHRKKQQAAETMPPHRD